MTVDLEARRVELVALRERVTLATEGILANDSERSEMVSSAADQHLADHASDTFDRELDETLEENASQVIREIDDALRRIDEGTYGLCAVCGREIPEERLEAIPYATLCIEDKRRQERG